MSPPIDIHCGKLLEWLKSRNLCSKNLSESVTEIRKKINHAILDMPEVEEIKTLLACNYINYFHCLKIVELLKGTEADTKNFFGRYSSQRIKDWNEIIRLYEKDGIYLGDSAQTLIRTVSYEIPALKKHIEKIKKSQNDYIRKEKEYASTSSEHLVSFSKMCKQYGLKGENVKRELLQLASGLGEYLNKCADEMKTLQMALNLYTDFIAYSLQRTEEPCQTLRTIIRQGNITVYELNHGTPPSRIEISNTLLDALKDEDKITNDNNDEIDWGAGDEGIDFDISVTDDIEISLEDAGGIEIESSTVESSGKHSDSSVATGDEALSILMCNNSRRLLINDLTELSAFVNRFAEERLTDQEGSNMVLCTFFQNAPDSVQNVDYDKATIMSRQIQSVLDKLTNTRTCHLLMIQNSPRYVDRIVDQVTEPQRQSERCKQFQKLMERKREEAVAEEAELWPQLETMKQHCRELQKQIESEISKKYSNRQVNIVGEILTI